MYDFVQLSYVYCHPLKPKPLNLKIFFWAIKWRPIHHAWMGLHVIYSILYAHNDKHSKPKRQSSFLNNIKYWNYLEMIFASNQWSNLLKVNFLNLFCRNFITYTYYGTSNNNYQHPLGCEVVLWLLQYVGPPDDHAYHL